MELFLNPGLKVASDAAAKGGRRSRALQTAFARVDPGVWIIGAALLAFVIKLAIALNTFGTNDVAAFYMFARSLHDHGLEWTYRNGVPWTSNFPVFNHPPLTAYYLQFIENLSRLEFFREDALTFPFLLRLPGIVADFVVVPVLLRISRTIRELELPAWALALFTLSPVSLMVSGFHGNTDPVMVMFLVIAAYMCLRERPILSGIFFALSIQIKVVPLLLLPIIFFFWLNRRVALRFAMPFLLLTLLMWSQPLIMFPRLFVGNVLAYGSYWGNWGITYWLRLTHWSQFDAVGFTNLPRATSVVTTLLKAGIVSAVLVIGWRRRSLGPTGIIFSIAYAWLVFFAFAPGFCAYYLIWLAPFILLFSRSLYTWLTAASSVFLFIFYNTLSGGFPWHIAVGKFSDPNRFNLIAPWALWPWAIIVCGLIIFGKKAAISDSCLRLLNSQALFVDD